MLEPALDTTGAADTADTAHIIHTYYEILGSGTVGFDATRLRAILATDLVFEGPIAGHVVGAKRFVKGVFGFIETARGLTMLHQIHSANVAATLYDAQLVSSPAHGLRSSPASRSVR